MLRSRQLWSSAAALVAGAIAATYALLQSPKRVGHALIVTGAEHTVNDPERGVRSVQAADLILPNSRMAELWTPRSLERLARTYWRWLSRATLGLVRVHYTDDGRQVRALGFIPLLTFKRPEYEMDADRGIVRWRIDRGILVARRGRGGMGYLEIEVHRRPSLDYPDSTIVHCEVEVANFYPAIATSISNWFYENTQSRIHVLVTHSFLKSLARLDLAESRVGQYAAVRDLPDPVRERDKSEPPLSRTGSR